MARAARTRGLVFGLTLTGAALGFAVAFGQVPSSPPQAPASASGFVLGRVLDATTKAPLGNVRVSLGGRDGGRGQETVLTNSDGYFLFRDLAAGSYTIAANATGYLSGGAGQRVAGGRTQPLAVGAGQRMGNVVVALWKAASISGSVIDERGEPISGLAVSLLPREQLAGPSRVTNWSGLSVATTDASGAYHFNGLLAGEYVISIASRTTQLPVAFANADAPAIDLLRSTGHAALGNGLRSFGPAVRIADSLVQTSGEGQWGGSNALAARLPFSVRPDGRITGYAPTFFPSATTPSDATPVVLAGGEDRANLTIRLRPITLSGVTGQLMGPEGPLGGWSVHLFPAFAVNSWLERSHGAGTTATAPDGRFSFLGVAPGAYVIKAWRLPPASPLGTEALPADPTLWASTAVTVGEQPLTGVSVTVARGAAVRGRIVLDGTAAPLPPLRFQTMLSVAFESSWSLAFASRLPVRINAALEFETQALPPGRYAPVLPNNFNVPGWYFESATRDGRDLMLSPLVLESGVDATDIVLRFGDRRTSLTGAVIDGAGRPAAAASVVAFPADYRSWIAGGLPSSASFEGAATQAGTFAMDVRPGEYLVAAIDEARANSWRTAAAINALAAHATRLTITRGDNTVPALRVSVVKGPRP